MMGHQEEIEAMTLPQIKARIESANLAALARNAGVSYWQALQACA